MPTNRPLDFQAIKGLQARLRTISQVAGYYNDVRETAVRLDPNCDVEALFGATPPRPFVVIQLLKDRYEVAAKQDEIDHTLTVRVHWISESTPSDDDSLLAVFCCATADIERALNIGDRVGDRSLGGIVTDLSIVGRAFDVNGDSSVEVWAQMDLALRINRNFGYPSNFQNTLP